MFEQYANPYAQQLGPLNQPYSQLGYVQYQSLQDQLLNNRLSTQWQNAHKPLSSDERDQLRREWKEELETEASETRQYIADVLTSCSFIVFCLASYTAAWQNLEALQLWFCTYAGIRSIEGLIRPRK